MSKKDRDYPIEEDMRALSAKEIDILNKDGSVNYKKFDRVMKRLLRVMNVSIDAQNISLQYIWDLSVQIRRRKEGL